MDGSNQEIIIRSVGETGPLGITLDEENARIYWAESIQHTLESATFDGYNRKRTYTTTYPASLAIVGDELYWTDWKNDRILV